MTLFFTIAFIKTEGQLWEHYYSLNFFNSHGSSIIQTYDGGYAAAIWNQGGVRSRLNKLDNDGNIIWSKIIFCPTGYEAIWDVCETSDGGFILSGFSSCYDPAGAAFIMRLNSCGERMWLREFGTFNDYDRIDRVIPLRDGNYLAAASYLGTGNNGWVGLIKFDLSGNVIWEGDYTHYNSPTLSDIHESNDSCIYITGLAYVADPGFTNPVKVRSHVIKVNSDGNEVWEVPLGLNDLILSRGNSLIELQDSKLLVLTEYNHPIYNLRQWNYLIKVDTTGQEIWKEFASDTNDLSEAAIGLLKLSDTTAMILCNVSYSHNTTTIYDFRLKAIKIDMDGNVLDSAQFGTGGNTYGMRAIVNDEGDVLVCGIRRFGNQTGPFAIKIRSGDLQIDTLMNISLTYDSLCPFPTVSDTIFYDTTSVGGSEPIHTDRSFKIYPNPTKDILFVEILIEDSDDAIILSLTDISGRKVMEVELEDNSSTSIVDVSKLKEGVYLCKIQHGGNAILHNKLVIVR